MEFIGREIIVTLPSGFSLEKKPPVAARLPVAG